MNISENSLNVSNPPYYQVKLAYHNFKDAISMIVIKMVLSLFMQTAIFLIVLKVDKTSPICPKVCKDIYNVQIIYNNSATTLSPVQITAPKMVTV